ncbi:hypothetical protein, variant 1 [Saprolegnia diclina VS20]|uniref:Uncharacterized protein n=2 Tax=Saprolegnia diclina (strain VS20) TaxID=1156394 RepID=T0Q6D0_SAPDV|nr:hypothetical protein, variant 1 [Saprolegnia diclina VS20]EQC28995.1 hypothetical protein, variant 1 [Saprolegnia diclina VS20]|eukprot:XP_008617635.1 hypothetical protein, variant 1 [Saprolegnia diclina VS20]
MGTYTKLEGKMSAKIHELQGQVAYYEGKFKEVDQLRRLDMNEHEHLRHRIQGLEDSRDDSRATQLRLQQEIATTRSALIEQEATVVQRDKTIAYLESENRHIMDNYHKRAEEYQATSEAQRQQKEELESTIALLEEASRHHMQHDAERDRVVEQLRIELCAVQAARDDCEAQLAALGLDAQDSAQTVARLTREVADAKAATTLLRESADEERRAWAQYEDEKERLVVGTQNLLTRHDKLLDWSCRRLDRARDLQLQQIVFLTWNGTTQRAKNAHMALQLQRCEAALSRFTHELTATRESLGQLRKSVAELSPSSTLSTAIVQACHQAVLERDVAYRYIDSLTLSNQEKSAQLHQLHTDLTLLRTKNELDQCSGSDKRALLQRDIEHLHNVVDGSKAAVRRQQMLVYRLCGARAQAKATLLATVFFYTWRDVHQRRTLGGWCNELLANTGSPGTQRVPEWHLMDYTPRATLRRLTLRFAGPFATSTDE